eukprot:2802286-Pleurochrysis_carterae.AAC.1
MMRDKMTETYETAQRRSMASLAEAKKLMSLRKPKIEIAHRRGSSPTDRSASSGLDLNLNLQRLGEIDAGSVLPATLDQPGFGLIPCCVSGTVKEGFRGPGKGRAAVGGRVTAGWGGWVKVKELAQKARDGRVVVKWLGRGA